MKAIYPTFLIKGPRFLGLSLTDLLIISIGLIISMLYEINSLLSICIIGLLIFVSKSLMHYFDIKGFFLTGFFMKPKRPIIIDWMDLINEEQL
jgi:hypothetical protein